jgi:hypothetical protein
MTHYVSILSEHIPEDQKYNLLQIANDNNLSISQFKELIKNSHNNTKKSSKINSAAFQKFHDAYIKALTRACNSEREVAVKSIKEVLSFAVKNELL